MDLRGFTTAFWALALIAVLFSGSLRTIAMGQKRRPRPTSQTSHSKAPLSPDALEMVELASVAVCKERVTDPKASVPIDEMQARPSLPVQSPEALAGAKRAQRLLPIAQQLVAGALRQLAREYNLRSKSDYFRIQRAINRVVAVRYVRADVDARDNATVFMRRPRTIIFGTIFLAGLPSDEGIISVLAHELMHIGDGGEDSLGQLIRLVGNHASLATGLKVQGQKAEELTSDLVGTLAARAYVSRFPSYEPLQRRVSRSLAHNCVSQDEGDEDHLSPKNTIRALLALSPTLARELVYGR